MNSLPQPYRDCLEACSRCWTDCQYCLVQMAGQDSKNDCPRCCIECINACEACVSALTAQSEWARDYCRICAKICDWCAEQCSAHDHDHCQRCASSSQACAEACRKIAA